MIVPPTEGGAVVSVAAMAAGIPATSRQAIIQIRIFFWFMLDSNVLLIAYHCIYC
jgi:hypothetical protein